MASQQTNPSSAWFDAARHTSLIAEKAQRTESFLAAMADGRIDPAEIAAQENRLVALMAEIEPQLDPRIARQGDGIALRTDGLRLHASDAVAGAGAAEDSVSRIGPRMSSMLERRRSATEPWCSATRDCAVYNSIINLKRRFSMAGQPKAPFYVVVAVVVAGLVAFAVYRVRHHRPQGQAPAARQDHPAGPRTRTPNRPTAPRR